MTLREREFACGDGRRRVETEPDYKIQWSVRDGGFQRSCKEVEEEVGKCLDFIRRHFPSI